MLIDYFLDGICKTAVYGKFPDAGARNRSISRQGALKPYNTKLVEKLLLTSSYRREELQEIADIRQKGGKPTLAHATYYWHSEHFTCQRPDWFASVRLYSTRTHNMEQPYNSEGLLNHHRGDGANHLSRSGDEYLDIWPVYDYQKIPVPPSCRNPNSLHPKRSKNWVSPTLWGRLPMVSTELPPLIFAARMIPSLPVNPGSFLTKPTFAWERVFPAKNASCR